MQLCPSWIPTPKYPILITIRPDKGSSLPINESRYYITNRESKTEKKMRVNKKMSLEIKSVYQVGDLEATTCKASTLLSFEHSIYPCSFCN